MKLKKLNRLLMAIWAASMAVQSAWAAEKKQPVPPEIIVTASRTEQAVDSASQSVSIITREQIVTRNARNVQELLEEIPGVSLSRAGGLDGQIVMRGSNSNDPRTVLFIDGDRFRGRNTLEYTLLDPNQIERIEVVRGPASSLYGPDAMAGIVNIITRRAKANVDGQFHLKPRLAGLNANSVNNLVGGRVELEGAGSGVDMLFGLNARKAGDYRSPQGTIPNSDFKTLSADLRLGYTLNEDHRVELTVKQAEIEAGRAGGIGGVPGAPLLQLREDPMRESFLKLSYQGKNPGAGFGRTEASLYARKLYTHIAIINRTTPNRLVQSDNWVDGPVVIGGKLIGLRPWGNANLLTLGVDFFHEDRKGTEQASSTTNFNAAGAITAITTSPRAQNVPDATQTDIGLFMHNDWEPAPQWTISGGVRTDYIRTKSATSPVPHPSLQRAYDSANQNSDAPLTGNLGLIYRPWQTWHFTANIGKAFRAPGTFESFGSSRQGTGFLVPNPALQSEEALVYEIGARIRLPKLRANLTAFDNDYSNLVVTRPVVFLGTNSTQRQNVGEARIRGLEFDAIWKFADEWQTSMNAASLRGTDTTTNRPLPYIPPLNGQFALRFDTAAYYVEGVGKWSLRKTRIDSNQERETAGFTMFNLYTGVDLWKLSAGLPKMRLIVGVENVLDKTYRQPTTVENSKLARSNTNSLLEPGRALTVSLNSMF